MMSMNPSALASVRSLVACNIYVSAGRPKYADTLLSLLSRAQEQCRILCEKNPSSSSAESDYNSSLLSEVAIVHAFTDGPYDRTSFHLAGRANAVAQLATFLATDAMLTLQPLLQQRSERNDDDNTLHPYVGIVDHVSILPLLYPPAKLVIDKTDDLTMRAHCGIAARAVGQSMESVGDCRVHYYGSAHPNRTPLAIVRREQTSFFKSGGLSEPSHGDDNAHNSYGVATVGAPVTFVENFNVRLRSERKRAVQLARILRYGDGKEGKGTCTGLLGVEALTLPYSDGRFEVACNLLRPHEEEGSSERISREIQKWEHRDLVESAYRVGTTEERCWKVLLGGTGNDSRKDHDDRVSARLKDYILGNNE